MINIKQEDMTEWDGFDVYDAETGENLFPSQVAEISLPEDITTKHLTTDFCLTWDGYLLLLREDGRTVTVPKEGKYLIQINGGKYMRW